MIWRSPNVSAISTTSTRQSAAPPPPPPHPTPPEPPHLSLITPRKTPDRQSVSSCQSASTTSTRDTLLLVSPSTPTRTSWLADPLPILVDFSASPSQRHQPEQEEWDESRSDGGMFRGDDDAGISGKAEMQSWWAGVSRLNGSDLGGRGR